MVKLTLANNRNVVICAAKEPIENGVTLGGSEAVAECLTTYGAVYVEGHVGVEPFSGVIGADDVVIIQ